MPLPNLIQISVGSVINQRMSQLGFQFKNRSGDYIRGSNEGYFLLSFEREEKLIIFSIGPEGIPDCSTSEYDFILTGLGG